MEDLLDWTRKGRSISGRLINISCYVMSLIVLSFPSCPAVIAKINAGWGQRGLCGCSLCDNEECLISAWPNHQRGYPAYKIDILSAG